MKKLMPIKHLVWVKKCGEQYQAGIDMLDMQVAKVPERIMSIYGAMYGYGDTPDKAVDNLKDLYHTMSDYMDFCEFSARPYVLIN